MNCGSGPVTVSPSPFLETGTGWFVDGRGFIITNAHVVDPAFRLPAWVTHELKKKAIDEAACCRSSAPAGSCARERPGSGGRHPPRGHQPGAREREGRGAAGDHRPALQRDEAEGRGQEVQPAAPARQRRQAVARLGARPGAAPRGRRRLPGRSGSRSATRRSATPCTSSASRASCSPTSSSAGAPRSRRWSPTAPCPASTRTRSARISCRPTRRPPTATAAARGSGRTPGSLACWRRVTLSSTGAPIQGFNFLIPAATSPSPCRAPRSRSPATASSTPVWARRHRSVLRAALQGFAREDRRGEQAGAGHRRCQAS